MASGTCILDSSTPIHYSISPNTLRRTLIKVIKIISGNKKLIELRTYPARKQFEKVRKSMTYTSRYEINFKKKIMPYQSFMRSKRQNLHYFPSAPLSPSTCPSGLKCFPRKSLLRIWNSRRVTRKTWFEASTESAPVNKVNSIWSR